MKVWVVTNYNGHFIDDAQGCVSDPQIAKDQLNQQVSDLVWKEDAYWGWVGESQSNHHKVFFVTPFELDVLEKR